MKSKKDLFREVAKVKLKKYSNLGKIKRNKLVINTLEEIIKVNKYKNIFLLLLEYQF